MTKVFFAPLNYGSVKQTGVCDAFQEAGCQLRVFDYFEVLGKHRRNIRNVRNMFVSQCVDFNPDLVLLQIQHTNVIDANAVRTARNKLPKTIIVNWTQDIRSYIPTTFRRVGMLSTYSLIPSTGQLDKYAQALGKNKVKFWQIGYNPKLYHPLQTPNARQYTWDAIFVGHYNKKEKYPGTQQRINGCRYLRKEFGNRFALFGDGWPRDLLSKGSIAQGEVNQAYNKSFCAVSINHFNDIEHYFSDRLLMCMASGRPTICYRFPGWQSYFTDMCDLVIANTLQEIPEKIKMLKANPELAEYIGRSGAAKVYSEHTYLSRIWQLLNMTKLR